MTKYKSIRQHYVPRFYLKNFARKTRPNTYQIRCFDKYKFKSSEWNINDVAVEKFFYDLQVPTVIENVLSYLENEFARAYHKIIKEHSIDSLTDTDFTIASTFLLIQHERTKSSRVRDRQIAEKVYEFLHENNPELKLPELESMDERYKNDLFDSMAHRGQLKFMFSFIMDVSEYEKDAPNPAKAIFNLDWILGINNTGFDFYTSDHPIFIFNPNRQEVPLQGYGQYAYSSKGVRIYFPLTPDLCLILFDKNVYPVDKGMGTKIWIDKDKVDMINTQIIAQAYRYVFSKSRDFKYVMDLLNEIPELRDPNRNRLV